MAPVGAEVANGPSPAKHPERVPLKGRYVTLLPLEPAHAPALYEAIGGPENDAVWTYLRDGPYHDISAFSEHVTKLSKSMNPLFFAVFDHKHGKVMGTSSLREIDVENRATEDGYVIFSPKLQRSPASTETAYLLARYAFDELGYRRYVWKANNLNEASKHAALRLGFTFEGVLRQHWIVKGRNRDSAIFSMLDCEWDKVKRGFELWLDPGNFTADGKQIQKLEVLRDSS